MSNQNTLGDLLTVMALAQINETLKDISLGQAVVDESENIRIDGDVYPKGDDIGLYNRLIDRADWDTSFRDGNLPAGYAWADDGLFTIPATVNNSYLGDYLRVEYTGTAPHFLAKSVSGNTDRWMTARVMPVFHTGIGLRVDDGSNNNAAYIRLRQVSDGVHQVSTTVTTNGVSTDTDMYTVPPGEFCFLSLRFQNVGSYSAAIFYSVAEVPGVYTRLLTGPVVTWEAARAGLLIVTGNGGSGGSVYVDAFKSDF